MLPYLVVFAIVIICTINAEKCFEENKKKKGIILVVISCLIMSILAAIRSDAVGKDIAIYVKPVFVWASNMSFLEYIKIGDLEKGYLLFVFIITKIFKDYHVILFFIELIITSSIYYFAYEERKKISMTMVIFIFLFMMYNDTFTMMRQYMALAFILISFIQLNKRNFIATIILFVLAVSMHVSSILTIIAYFIYIFENNDKISNRNKSLMNMLIIFFTFIITIAAKELVYFFTNIITILPGKLYYYFTTNYYNDVYSISTSILLLKIIFLILTIVYTYTSNRNNKEKNICKTAILYMFIDLSIFISSGNLASLMRLGYYFWYPAVLVMIPKMKNIKIKDANEKITKYLIQTLIIILICSNWIFNFVIHNESGATVPYKSEFIEILK